MDRAMLEIHVDMAERHVADGERHIARQRNIVAELERDGQDSVQATRLLRSFEQTQALHVADRDPSVKGARGHLQARLSNHLVAGQVAAADKYHVPNRDRVRKGEVQQLPCAQ